MKEDGKIKFKKFFSELEYELKPIPKTAVWKDILEEGSLWAYPKENSFKRQVRAVYEDYEKYKLRAETLKEKILYDHAEEKIVKRMSDSIVEDGYLNGFAPYNNSNTTEEMLRNWRIEN